MLRQTKAPYDEKMNYLLFMDDLKLFAKNQNQIDSLVNTVSIFSEYIKIVEFWSWREEK